MQVQKYSNNSFTDYLWQYRWPLLVSFVFFIIANITYLSSLWVHSSEDIYYLMLPHGSWGGIVTRTQFEGRFMFGIWSMLLSGMMSPIFFKTIIIIAFYCYGLIFSFAYRHYLSNFSVALITLMVASSPLLIAMTTFPLSFGFFVFGNVSMLVAYLLGKSLLPYTHGKKRIGLILLILFLCTTAIGLYQATLAFALSFCFIDFVFVAIVQLDWRKYFRTTWPFFALLALSFVLYLLCYKAILIISGLPPTMVKAEQAGYHAPSTILDYFKNIYTAYKDFLRLYLSENSLSANYEVGISHAPWDTIKIFFVLTQIVYWLAVLVRLKLAIINYFKTRETKLLREAIIIFVAALALMLVTPLFVVLPFIISGSPVIARALYPAVFMLPSFSLLLLVTHKKIHGAEKNRWHIFANLHYALLFVLIVVQLYYSNLSYTLLNNSFKHADDQYRSVFAQLDSLGYSEEATVFFYDLDALRFTDPWPYLLGDRNSPRDWYSRYYLGRELAITPLNPKSDISKKILADPNFSAALTQYKQIPTMRPLTEKLLIDGKTYFVVLTNSTGFASTATNSNALSDYLKRHSPKTYEFLHSVNIF